MGRKAATGYFEKNELEYLRETLVIVSSKVHGDEKLAKEDSYAQIERILKIMNEQLPKLDQPHAGVTKRELSKAWLYRYISDWMLATLQPRKQRALSPTIVAANNLLRYLVHGNGNLQNREVHYASVRSAAKLVAELNRAIRILPPEKVGTVRKNYKSSVVNELGNHPRGILCGANVVKKVVYDTSVNAMKSSKWKTKTELFKRIDHTKGLRRPQSTQ